MAKSWIYAYRKKNIACLNELKGVKFLY